MKRILIINQYFPPDRAATAILLGHLAKHLAQTCQVEVLCSQATYDPDPATAIKHPNIHIRQSFALKQNRKNPFVRLLNYVAFSTVSVLRIICSQKPDAILAWTDPPWNGAIASFASWWYKAPLTAAFQDVYPEVAFAAGIKKNPLIEMVFGRICKTTFARAKHVIAISHCMKQRLGNKGCPTEKIAVIENWQNTQSLTPKKRGYLQAAYNINPEHFLIMHSGNIGVSQDFSYLLALAELCKHNPISIAIVGNGGKKAWLENEISQKKLSNVYLLPYQDEDKLSESLSSADLHYVSLLEPFTGLIVPSKMYGVLCVGRAIAANISPESLLSHTLDKADCGKNFFHDPKAMHAWISSKLNDSDYWQRLGKNGRTWYEAQKGMQQSLEKYQELLL